MTIKKDQSKSDVMKFPIQSLFFGKKRSWRTSKETNGASLQRYVDKNEIPDKTEKILPVLQEAY